MVADHNLGEGAKLEGPEGAGRPRQRVTIQHTLAERMQRTQGGFATWRTLSKPFFLRLLLRRHHLEVTPRIPIAVIRREETERTDNLLDLLQILGGPDQRSFP